MELMTFTDISPGHFDVLANIKHNAQGGVGKNPYEFGNRVQTIEHVPAVFSAKCSRKDLFQYVNEPALSNLTVTVAILAWGGMRENYARRLFQNWKYLNPIIERIRSGSIKNRKLAFQLFYESRAKGYLPGLGISYYTKLICFLNHKLNAYILDQWTGKSINLLWQEPFIKFTGNWVNDKNNSDTYEEFCNRIEELADLLVDEPITVEERLFSNGGHNPGAWRRHLKENYKKWLLSNK